MGRITYIGLIAFALFFRITSIQGQIEVPESPGPLYAELKDANDNQKTIIYLQLARYYFYKDNDSLLYYVNILEERIKKDYDKRMDAFVKKFRSYEAGLNLDIEKSIELGKESMQIFDELKDNRESGWIRISLADSYIQLGDLATATELAHQAIDLFEDLDQNEGMSRAYNLLGNIVYTAENMEKAREYFEKSLSYLDLSEETYYKYRLFNNLALVLSDEEKYDEALKNYKKAEQGFISTKDFRSLSLVYGNMALCYGGMNEADSGLLYTRKAMHYAKLIEDRYATIAAYINMGYFIRLHRKYDSCLILLDSAYYMAHDLNMPGLEESIFEEYEGLYHDLGDYEKAYQYRVSYDSVHKLVLDVESQLQIEDLNFNFKRKLEEQELNQLREKQMFQTRNNRIFFSVLLVLLITSGALIYITIQNRKHRRSLTSTNELLSSYNAKLEASEKELMRNNEDKSKLFSIVAHDLRNPLSAVTGFSELLTARYSELSDKERREYISNILQGAHRSAMLLENLLLWARSQMDMLEIKKSDVKVSSLINESVEVLKSSLEQKKLKTSVFIEKDFTLHVDKEMIKAVIRNLLSNAIKFSFTDQVIEIKAVENSKDKYISVTDHGTGIEPELLDKLFRTQNLESSVGTLNEPGSGLGLKISLDYTEKNGGKIKSESIKGKGSVFTISFPL